ncbi:MAG: glycosyltransferase family 2 protein [Bacteroidota bacterium]|nr:glycosyltransferase family 2 protein [Bacteroidota bacterium]
MEIAGSNSFSVVLPVRNGGSYIKECVASVLSQSFRNFNLIVLDNASTDDTVAWLETLKDPRIIIYPSATSLTIEQNWGRIKTVTRNKFMIITGHDDIMHPDYLEVMDELIRKHPTASLYQSHFNFIDEYGAITRACKPMQEVQSAADFFRETLENGGGFVIRSADYDAVGGIPEYPNLFFSDFVLWMELSRISYKATTPVNAFSYRVHSRNTTATSADDKYHAAFERFVDYLYALKTKDAQLNDAINTHSRNLISIYCKGLSHRLLRTPLEKRNNLTVSQLAKRYKAYADKLIDNNTFDPSAIPGVRLARIIDSNPVTRNLFLLFKKVFPKPIGKSV